MNAENLTPLDRAVQVVLENVVRLPAERCAIADAVGRALIEPVLAQRTVPAFDNSAMDGYALRSVDGVGPLTVVDKIFAGQRPNRPVGRNECARIMTGAALPPGADAVVMQERVRVEGGRVTLEAAVASGANVRRAGEDARAGSALLPAGTPIGLGEAGLMWGQGLTDTLVSRRPAVAIATSGDELKPVGDASGATIDTNTPMIAAAAARAGARTQALGIAGDTLEQVTALLRQGLGSDVLITVAGMSVGEKDFVRAALEQLGVEVLFHRVAIKPAKPVLFGKKGNTLVFGLPGNPTSALVAFELFVRPALRALQGLSPHPLLLPARLATPFRKSKGLTHLVRVTAYAKDGALWAEPLPSQTSGALASAAGATYLMRVPQGVDQLEAGATVDLISVTWSNS